jgi:predicted transposase YbfD/YdcC
MKASPSQCLRALRHSDVPWDVNVLDARDPRGVRYAHHGLLNAVLVGLATGKRTFRGVEETVEDLSPSARRRLGIPKSVSDSTLYRLIAAQGAEGFRETLQNQFDELWESEVARNDLFPIGIVSIDGKGTWSSTDTHVEGAKESSCDTEGKPLWFLGTLRAVLTSSRLRPCIDMELIAAKEAESPTFRKMFPRLCKEAGRRFKVVTGDAGLTCRENALLVREHGKHYVFALKGNQPTLHNLAQSLLWAAPNELRVEERMNGKLVVRELARICFGAGDERIQMPDVRQLWRIRQTTIAGQKAPVVEDRYFITSVDWLELDAAQVLALIRLHWGIENGHNWTMDVIFGEDDSQPCQQGKDAIEVIAWLRILAYNLVAAWRARARPKDGQPMPWRRVMEKLRDSLVHGNLEASLATGV